MADTKSKVLIIGATGYLGNPLVQASIKHGHPTFILVRSTSPSDPAKAQLLKSFEESGVTVLKGDLNDHESLVGAFRRVDVVISTVDVGSIPHQVKILEAAKEAGTIKRFIPSDFTIDVDRLEIDFEAQEGVSGLKRAVEVVFGLKRNIRREIEKSGIPYTFVVSGGFAGQFTATLVQEDVQTPPRSKVTIWGDGNAKVALNCEEDIATYTIRCIDDARAENKRFHIRPRENIVSQNDVVAFWEQKISHTLEKNVVSKEEVAKIIEETPFPGNVLQTVIYCVFIKGGLVNFELNSKEEVDATELYPDVKCTSVSAYLDRFV